MKKKLFIRISTLVFALVFCIGCVVGCKGDDEGASSETSTVADGSGFTIGGGSASFTVVYPNNPPSVVSTALETLLAAFESKTGTRPDTATDYLERGKLYNSSTYEIFLGRTDHEQTQSVLSELENGQYAIRVVGNKIVITAPKDADIATAVDYFVANFINANLVDNGGTYSLAVTDYTSEAIVVDTTVTVNGNDIADYTIVYETARDGYMDVATRLRNKMETLGYKVSISRDDTTPETSGAKEILIGKTNRSVSQTLYGETQKLLTYSVVVSGTYVQVLCGGPYSARECVDAMQLKFFGAKDKAFKDGEYMVTDMNLPVNNTVEGTDLRIMTSNVLAARWATEETYPDCPPVVQRAEIYAATLISSKPDVIGVQEADNDWITYLPYYLTYIKDNYNIEYEWIFEDWKSDIQSGVDKGQTLTSIIFRSDKYSLMDSGIENAEYWTSTEYNMRLLEWALLAEKTNSAHRFIITNTHWGYEAESTGVEGKDKCVQLSVDKINWLKAQYPNTPIFSTGDYNANTSEESDYICRLLPETGSFDAMLEAVENGVRVNNCGGCGVIGGVRHTSGNYIDHIACFGDTVEVLKYETLVGKNIYCSDHSPQIADISIY